MTKQVTQSILLFLLLSILAFLVPLSVYAFDEEVVEIVVEEGDYLIKLGEEYLEDPHRWKEVARINHLKNPDLIYPIRLLSFRSGFCAASRATEW